MQREQCCGTRFPFMKILFCSVLYSPSVGGIETVSATLAGEFHRAGHSVTLVTQSPSAAPDDEAYLVVRRPGWRQLWRMVRESDVVFHNNISLRLGWPLVILRRPWVVAHHTWIPHQGVAARLKRRLLRFASNVSVSHAVARDLPVRSTVLPNPYRSSLFRPIAGVARTKDVVFLGRLVCDKGAGMLLDALHLLQSRGLVLRATLIGEGPEEADLKAQSERLGLSPQVEFVGSQTGERLVRLLHEHQVLVVPSVWEEPFGLVVLEAIACGCIPLVAQSGGLPDAAGPCGRVFAKGNVLALADGMQTLYLEREGLDSLRKPEREHLSRHLPERVAVDYLRVLSDACRGNSPIPV